MEGTLDGVAPPRHADPRHELVVYALRHARDFDVEGSDGQVMGLKRLREEA